MSLVGNLADLGLGDIFQIVSLSRRSGTLQLTTPRESGEIVFIAGKVVAASRDKPAQTVGEVLLDTGVVSPTLYQEMLAAQSHGVEGEALLARFDVKGEALDKACESMLTRLVYEMFEWDEGTFSFVLEQEPPLWRGFNLGAGRVVLGRGLNPQYLAIEATRLRDEKQRADPLESFLALDKAAEGRGASRHASEAAAGELASDLAAAGAAPAPEVPASPAALEAPPAAAPMAPLTQHDVPTLRHKALEPIGEENTPIDPPRFAEATDAEPSEPSLHNIIPFPHGRTRREPGLPDIPPPAPIVPAPAFMTASPAAQRAFAIPPPAPIVPAPFLAAEPPVARRDEEPPPSEPLASPALESPPEPLAAPELPETHHPEAEAAPPSAREADELVAQGRTEPLFGELAPPGAPEVMSAPPPAAPEVTLPVAAEVTPSVAAEVTLPAAAEVAPAVAELELPVAAEVTPSVAEVTPLVVVEAALPAAAAPPPVDVPTELPTLHQPALPPVAAAPPAAGVGHHLLLIDDDPVVTRFLAAAMGKDFAAVHTANRVADALSTLERIGAVPVVVATDLILPRSDGRGILGGVELLEAIRERSREMPVVMFSDYQNDEAEARARGLGVQAFLTKPRKSQIQVDPEGTSPSDAMQDFIERLSASVASYAGPSAPPFDDKLYDLSTDLAEHLGDLVDRADRELGPRDEAPRELGNLRSMLAELIDPANRDTITLLVLRFASDVVERAALFLATRRAYVGLGGFSAEEGSDTFVGRVRRLHVPVDLDSAFSTVTRYRTMVRGPLADTPGNRRLIEGLGGRFHQNPAAAAPIISRERVAAILYCDNPSGKPLGSTEGLEIFLQQAGLAMDRALLERRLEETRRKRTDEIE